MQGSSDEIDAPGAREEVEEPPAQPVQPPDAKEGGSNGASPMTWTVVAVVLGGIALLTAFAVWRRRA